MFEKYNPFVGDIETVSIDTPLKPMMEYWYLCPRCGDDPDFPDLESGEVEEQADGTWLWIGPTRCPSCGQAIDLSELNQER